MLFNKKLNSLFEIPVFFKLGVSVALLSVGQLQFVHGDGVRSRWRDVLTPKTNRKVQVSFILT